MTWKDAIVKVLTEEGAPLHYSDITKRIIDNGYRKPHEMGKTPDMTVSAQLTTKKNIFRKLGNGVFELLDAPVNRQTLIDSDSDNVSTDNTTESQDMLSVERDHIIKNYGMFWSRDNVDWKTANLYGCQNGSSSNVNFKDQVGVYLLHDAREVVYVGQAVKQPISKRLADHCKDRLNGRWDRFSWFGFYGVDEDGRLITNDFHNTNFSIENVANTLEAVLIEGLEPRQNRKNGNDFGYEFLQATDPKIEKKKQKAIIEKLLSEQP
ncbi:MAG: HTH domain-containing protein [Alistipes sp.]